MHYIFFRIAKDRWCINQDMNTDTRRRSPSILWNPETLHNIEHRLFLYYPNTVLGPIFVLSNINIVLCTRRRERITSCSLCVATTDGTFFRLSYHSVRTVRMAVQILRHTHTAEPGDRIRDLCNFLRVDNVKFVSPRYVSRATTAVQCCWSSKSIVRRNRVHDKS